MLTETTTQTVEKSSGEDDLFVTSTNTNDPIVWNDGRNINSNNATVASKINKDSTHGSDTFSNVTDPSDWTDDIDNYESDNCVHQLQLGIGSCFEKHKSQITTLIAILCLAGYTVYLAFAIKFDFELAKSLIVITGIVLFCIIYSFIRDYFGGFIYEKIWTPLTTPIQKRWHILQW